MKITEVKVWLVEGVKYNWTLPKVYTDTGHTGVGEATNWPGSPIIEAAAVGAGRKAVGQLGKLIASHVITRPREDIVALLPK
jgi:galactonate dehydratase